MLRAWLLFFAFSTAYAADLKSKLDENIASWPSLSNASMGLEIVSLKDGRVLYDREADRRLVPASNMKLFTTALALSRLGPDYRLRTTLGADRAIDSAGVLNSDLLFIGGGDPSLSGRAYPYQIGPSEGYFSFKPIDDLIAQLVAKGLKRINGDIVGDDRRYVWSPYADGWSFGDAAWGYGAPVSALIVNDNSFGLTIQPGAEAGDPARLSLNPAFEYFAIDNRVRTVETGPREIEFGRDVSGRQLHVWGTIPVNDEGITQLLAVNDPALYAAEVLRDALTRRGIAIHGRATARHRYSDDVVSSDAHARVVLAERISPPLAQILQVASKVSQNLHAEMILREVDAVRKHSGLSELRALLDDAGIPPTDYSFGDGSGLSRNTLVTASAITKILAYMYKSEQRDVWMSLLPIAGVDGTLRLRFADHPEARAIRAKTGTLAHVRANSGYIDSNAYGPLAFAFLINNYSVPTADVSRFLDALELALVN